MWVWATKYVSTIAHQDAIPEVNVWLAWKSNPTLCILFVVNARLAWKPNPTLALWGNISEVNDPASQRPLESKNPIHPVCTQGCSWGDPQTWKLWRQYKQTTYVFAYCVWNNLKRHAFLAYYERVLTEKEKTTPWPSYVSLISGCKQDVLEFHFPGGAVKRDHWPRECYPRAPM